MEGKITKKDVLRYSIMWIFILTIGGIAVDRLFFTLPPVWFDFSSFEGFLDSVFGMNILPIIVVGPAFGYAEAYRRAHKSDKPNMKRNALIFAFCAAVVILAIVYAVFF